MKNKVLLLSMGLVAALIASGCAGDTQPKNGQAGSESALYNLAEAQSVIDQIGRNVILATYEDLHRDAMALNQACEELAAQRTQSALDRAQAAWVAARVPWESTESFLIGPVDALGIDPKLDTWPLAINDLQAVLNSNPVISRELVRSLDTNLQGFHTAEFLLFGDGVQTNNKPLASFTDRELAYLVAVTGVITEYTGALVSAWKSHFDPEDPSTPAFIDIFTLKVPHSRTGFTNRAQVLQTIIKEGLAGIADEVGNGKLATPMGGDIGSADPSQVESQFSWNSLADFQNNIDSMSHLYTGDYRTQGPGIDSLVQKLDPALDRMIVVHLASARKKIGDISGPQGLPFTVAIKDPAARERVNAAIAEMHALFELMDVRLAQWVN